MRNLEGTHSSNKPRNQILETPESREHKSRNQILAMPEGRDSSEKDEKLDQNDGTESKSEQSKRSSLEKLKGLKNCVTENLGKTKRTETGEKTKHPLVDKIKDAVEHARGKITDTVQSIREGFDKKKNNEIDKPEAKKDTVEGKEPEFDFSWGTSNRAETKINDAPDKKKNNETSNTSDDDIILDRDLASDMADVAKHKEADDKFKKKEADDKKTSEKEVAEKKVKQREADQQQIQQLHNLDSRIINNEVAKKKTSNMEAQEERDEER